jgi:leucyl-tRNA synthetase
LADKKKLEYWLPVDLYNGGMEHTTLHLLYSRFWHKFLYDIGIVSTPEPYAVRRSHGMVLAEDGGKMSKSRGNVVNPDEVILKYGADTLRMYEMFMGPFEEAIPWSTKGMIGVRRFLQKVWKIFREQRSRSKGRRDELKTKKTKNSEREKELERLLHQTIKKVSSDIDNFKFNTAIAQLMIYINEFQKEIDKLPQNLIIYHLSIFTKLLAPFAPHIAEELWESLGYKQSIHSQEWPKYSEELVKEEEIELVVQVNGKVKDKIRVEVDITEEEVLKLIKERPKIKDLEIKRVVFVPRRLVNLVT